MKYNSGRFKKGHILSEETKRRMSETLKRDKRTTGEKQWKWKGDKVSYSALHHWVRRHLGTPKHCAICRNDNLRHKQYHWANVSKAYKRELSDWIRLCVKCHSNYDRGKLNLTLKN